MRDGRDQAVDRYVGYRGSGGVLVGTCEGMVWQYCRGGKVCRVDEDSGGDLSQDALSTSTGWLVDPSVVTRCV